MGWRVDLRRIPWFLVIHSATEMEMRSMQPMSTAKPKSTDVSKVEFGGTVADDAESVQSRGGMSTEAPSDA